MFVGFLAFRQNLSPRFRSDLVPGGETVVGVGECCFINWLVEVSVCWHIADYVDCIDILIQGWIGYEAVLFAKSFFELVGSSYEL